VIQTRCALNPDGVGSGNDSPCRIVPHFGQVSENDSKPPRSESWAVFHEREPGLYLANDPGELGPESAALSSDPGAFSGGGNVLAWETAADAEVIPDDAASLDESGGVGIVGAEGLHVVPNRESRYASVNLPLQQNSSGIFFDFDRPDAGVPKEGVREESSACAGEEMESSEGIKFHVTAFSLVSPARPVARSADRTFYCVTVVVARPPSRRSAIAPFPQVL